MRVVVSVLDGQVTIEGVVETPDDRQVIEGVAHSVEGVREFDSYLTVSSTAD